jgi:LmbE family N-acetylglucosaminyl deacetylase
MFDPHPDDADWWTGGLSLLLREAGWDVHYVCCGPTTAETRAQAEASAKVLDIQRRFLDITLAESSNLRADLYTSILPLLRELEPEMIFMPSLTDYHQEHVELSRELVALVKILPRHKIPLPEVYCYDAHMSRDVVEVLIDIASVHEKHMEALRCHRVFARPGVFPDGDNTLTRVKTGRAMILGASLPGDTRSLFAEGYRIIRAHPCEVSTLRLLFPDKFHYQSSGWFHSMWYT